MWNSITSYHSCSFNNLHTCIKLFSSYKKKFLWLLHITKRNEMSRINPINYNVIINSENYKITKAFHIKPTITTNETLINIKINSSHFFHVSRDFLNYTNTRWFKNLCNTHIPTQVSNLLQFGDKFSLLTHNNKKRAIHEIIKNVESNIKNSHIENQIKIRNTIIPQFHKFLHIKLPKNNTNEKLISLLNYTIGF